MQGLLKRLLNGGVTALGFLAVLATVPPAYSLGVSLFTPSTINFQAALPDLNTLINNINSAVAMNFAATTNSNAGEPQFTSAAAFAQNAGVATALSSVGPVGSHTTVQEWLVVVDASGVLRYAPLF